MYKTLLAFFSLWSKWADHLRLLRTVTETKIFDSFWGPQNFAWPGFRDRPQIQRGGWISKRREIAYSSKDTE